VLAHLFALSLSQRELALFDRPRAHFAGTESQHRLGSEQGKVA